MYEIKTLKKMPIWLQKSVFDGPKGSWLKKWMVRRKVAGWGGGVGDGGV